MEVKYRHYIGEVSPHRQDRLTLVNLKWPLEQIIVRAGVGPQNHTPYMTPEAGSLIRLVTAEEEGPAGPHEWAVQIP